MYLLDSNVFIFAKRDYYPFERIPHYWQWLLRMAGDGHIKIPRHIYDELRTQDDDLSKWLKRNKSILTLDNQNYDTKIPDVLSHYGLNVSDSDLVKMGADPFLIAAGLETKSTIVSKEGSKPTAQGANRKIPDICKSLDIECISDFELIKRLDFKIPFVT